MPLYANKVFISAVAGDLGTFRQAVRDELEGKGVVVDWQKGFLPDARTVPEMLREKLETSDLVIHLAGFAAELGQSTRLFQLQRSGCDLMKTTKALFFELIHDFQSERWSEVELPKLSLQELLALARLRGCPSCGSEETVIIRLLAQRELRLKVESLYCCEDAQCGNKACGVPHFEVIAMEQFVGTWR
jgi:hypothetical protein